jgi:hypothetical protein
MIYIQNGIIQFVQKVTNLDKLFLGSPIADGDRNKKLINKQNHIIK